MLLPFEEKLAQRRQVTFAVVGDFHYVHCLNAKAPHSAQEYYVNNRTTSLPVLERLGEHQPDFIIHTGDIIEGHLSSEEEAIDEIRAVLAIFNKIAPTFFAKGNHPSNSGIAAVLSRLIGHHHTGLLGRDVNGSEFSFSAGPAYIILTDTFCLGRESESLAWLKNELVAADAYARCFVAGHGPLYPIGRPYFTNLEYARPAAQLLNDAGVDAYFCGHTHNQLVSLHRPRTESAERRPILQCKGSLVGTFERRNVVSLAQARNLASRGESFDYLWGLLENGWPGWFLVRCSYDEVTLEGWYWASPVEATRGVLRWKKAGSVVVEQTPALPCCRAYQQEDLKHVKNAWLCLAGYKQDDAPLQVHLNGNLVASLGQMSSYAPQSFELTEESRATLKSVNEIRITTSVDFCMGGFQLVLELYNGEFVRSRADQHVYVSSDLYSLPDLDNAVIYDGGHFEAIAIEF